MQITKRAALVAGAASVLALAGGGTAFAAGGSTALNDALAVVTGSPISSSGVISGCYTTKAVSGSHALVLQNVGTTCPSGTTAVTWNQTGPAGPAGATGAIGPAGPQGPAGPGISVPYRTATSYEVPAATVENLYGYCNGGSGSTDFATGGGYEITAVSGASPDFQITYTGPALAAGGPWDNGWEVQVFNNDPVNALGVQVEAVCVTPVS